MMMRKGVDPLFGKRRLGSARSPSALLLPLTSLLSSSIVGDLTACLTIAYTLHLCLEKFLFLPVIRIGSMISHLLTWMYTHSELASVYSFVDAIEAVPDKVQILEETIQEDFHSDGRVCHFHSGIRL
jgi:hypothetical protein